MEVSTADGRTLEVLVGGESAGFPLVFHHGTPQGAIPFPLLERVAHDRNLRVVSYSRPGYGRSSPRMDAAAAATVADDATDVAVILDALGQDEFVTLGWSGGGPRALACAAMLPARCRAAACCVGLAPPAEYDGDIRDGMGPENVQEYTAAFAGPADLQVFLDEAGQGLESVTADDLVESFGGLLPEVDKRALTGELADYLAASLRHGLHQGVTGWRDDDLTHIRPWGFSVTDITVPVAIWQGTDDLMVPFAHARWLAAHTADARAHLLQGEGHISLFAMLGVIVDDLLDLAGLQPTPRGP